MSARHSIDAQKSGEVFKLNATALRSVMANPWNQSNSGPPHSMTLFNSCASQDPVREVLEYEIIPRLMLPHLVDSSVNPLFGVKKERFEIDARETQDFMPLPLRMDARDLLQEVDRFLEQGMSVEDVYINLLAPAAHYLGELWKTDECDFVDVTMGLWRLQEVMREITRRSPPVSDPIRATRSALFCPIPGDVHSFGAQMIEDVFARAGWHSGVLLKPTRRELINHVSRQPLDLVGLTVSRDSPVSALAGLVKAIRSVSVKPNLVVLVGGHMINQNPACVEAIGADGTGVDARSALEAANRLVPAVPLQAPLKT
ncbi:MAG: cobalamin-dependent protein [Pseudomonadota bacterium]